MKQAVTRQGPIFANDVLSTSNCHFVKVITDRRTVVYGAVSGILNGPFFCSEGHMARASVLFILLGLLAMPSLADDSRWFASIGAGANQHDAELRTDSGVITLLSDPSDNGTPIVAALGYHFSQNWFTELEYTYLDADETELQNLALSINYQWALGQNWDMYIGLVGGGSTLDWQENPIFATTIETENEENYLGGQIGLKARLNDRWSIHGKYQYLDLEHNTLLQPQGASGEFEQTDYHFVTLSLEVSF